MNLENSSQFKAAVKQEYLPPPLENNYLSLLDIQAKMAVEFLQGSDQQKIATIKKRIKKFFDYGNDQTTVDIDLTKDSNSKRTAIRPHTQLTESLMIGLKIFASQIIVYAKEDLTIENVAKIFPDFISSEKIDDCNLKLLFTNQKEVKKILKQFSKEKDSITAEHIENPSEIQWFEVQLKPRYYEDSGLIFYVRYATNKDELLFENDKYFRKLLGKARQILEKKKKQDELREIELKEKAQKKALINERKKFTVKRYRQDGKPYSKDFDAVTNYDGAYTSGPCNGESSFNRSLQDIEHLYPGQRNWKKHKGGFKNLDISQVQDRNFYEQQKYEYNPRKRSYRQNRERDLSIDFNPMDGRKKRSETRVFEDSREKMIKAHREKSSVSGNDRRSRFYDSANHEERSHQQSSHFPKANYNC